MSSYNMSFDNKVVIVTGGAGGIGKALGRTFLQNGAKVCLCDINVKEGEKLLPGLQEEFVAKNVMFLRCDVSKDEDFQGAFKECEKKWGSVDIVINNAAIISKDPMHSMAVNFGGVVRGTELAFNRIGKHNGGKGGHIVNIGSTAGVVPFPALPHYCASKAAIIHYSRCMGNELHFNYSGITVLCLCPDAVDTSMPTVDVALEGSLNSYTDEAIKTFIPKITNKLAPVEVAETVLQLIRENKSGSVVGIEKGLEPFPIDMPLSKEFV